MRASCPPERGCGFPGKGGQVCSEKSCRRRDTPSVRVQCETVGKGFGHVGHATSCARTREGLGCEAAAAKQTKAWRLDVLVLILILLILLVQFLLRTASCCFSGGRGTAACCFSGGSRTASFSSGCGTCGGCRTASWCAWRCPVDFASQGQAAYPRGCWRWRQRHPLPALAQGELCWQNGLRAEFCTCGHPMV